MIIKMKPTLIVFLLLAVLLTACTAAATTVAPTAASVPAVEAIPTSATALSPTGAPAATTVSFANDVLPILQSRCLNCHGGQQTQRGLSVASYATLMAGSDNGPVIVAGDSANSLLIQMIQQGKMPMRGPKLTPDQLQILIDWITAGALNN
jgi:uncharacterized membrane protein